MTNNPLQPQPNHDPNTGPNHDPQPTSAIPTSSFKHRSQQKKKKKTTEPENERVDGETEKEEREENFNIEIEGREISGEKGGIKFFFLRDNFFFLEYCYSVILILE